MALAVDLATDLAADLATDLAIDKRGMPRDHEPGFRRPAGYSKFVWVNDLEVSGLSVAIYF